MLEACTCIPMVASTPFVIIYIIILAPLYFWDDFWEISTKTWFYPSNMGPMTVVCRNGKGHCGKCICISIYLSIHPSISIYLSLHPYISISIYLYLYLYLSLSISIYLYLSLSISIYLPTYLSIYLALSLSHSMYI